MPALRPGVWGKKSFSRIIIPQDVVYHEYEYDNKVQLSPFFWGRGKKEYLHCQGWKIDIQTQKFEERDGSGGWGSGTKAR